MSRPSKKDIKAALEKLREPKTGPEGKGPVGGSDIAKPTGKAPNKNNRIRKQGV
ncbi:MAG: hypothetical protein ABL949_06210 [Fimbriimonadaceae bacterium]